MESLCQPIPLATGEAGVSQVAVGGGFVLWTVRDAVRRVRTTGGTPETFAAAELAVDIVTDGANVIWIDQNSVKLKQLGTPNDAPLTLYQLPDGAPYDRVSGLAVNATSVFFALGFGNFDGENQRVPLIGGSAIPVGSAYNTSTLAVDDTYLYAQVYVQLVASPIDRVDGSADLVIDTQRAVDIVLDATHVYWGTQDAIKRRQKPAGDVEFVATEATTIVSIAVDASSVYWSTADGHIRRAPKEGGTIETLVSDQSSPRSVGLDDVAVYWANRGILAGNPSSILKLAK
jgi:hypothetical protein